ncbi:hypothetical protein OJ962_23970 [Solirubrobacter sp. CPCC 204708]|uniref:Uncharacterized protein n=1 Tax=Solirubrobacter deserti TaxID=2282478 RepID=A0ABT4RQK6_9ACTN|nr:hypothetical protein [Solirubrobacter deserti]MDA0140575.1 hypothetical protein [Solirubrobacter deserti]
MRLRIDAIFQSQFGGASGDARDGTGRDIDRRRVPPTTREPDRVVPEVASQVERPTCDERFGDFVGAG